MVPAFRPGSAVLAKCGRNHELRRSIGNGRPETGAAEPVRTGIGSATGAVFDAASGLGHFVLNRVAQCTRSSDDACRHEGEQKRVLDRRNAAFVVPKSREILC